MQHTGPENQHDRPRLYRNLTKSVGTEKICAMDGESSECCSKHALLLAVNLQAHVVGMYRLALQLAKRGVTVTFVSQERDIEVLKTSDELQGLDFNLVSYGPSYTPTLLDPFGGSRKLRQGLLSIETIFQPIRDKLIADQKSGVLGPTCIIGDKFLLWVKDVAKELNVPYYLFFSNGAVSAREAQSTPEMFAADRYVEDETTKQLLEFEGFVKIPGLPALRFGELPSSTKYVPSANFSMTDFMEKADGLIFNTFYELESTPIDALQQSFVNHSRGKIQNLFLIGPLATGSSFRNQSFTSTTEAQGSDCLRWLNTQPTRSVLYICSGSIAHWTSARITELATALEATAQRFLWVIRLGADISSLEEVLPSGYEARMRDRGLIVTGWVPQQQILAHSSVGGFMTHCGWNSLIESVSSGVPMIGWPCFAEQFLNCRYFVDVLKIAVEVEGTERNFVRRAELEKAIRLMVEEGPAMRQRVQELMVKARAVVADGGSSQRAIIKLVNSIPSRS